MKSSRVHRALPSPACALLALAVLLQFPLIPAAAQVVQGQTAIVIAFVTDTAGRPVAGAEVQVMGTSIRGSTDDAGRVALLAIPTGKAVLRRLGFAELTGPISVTASGTPDARYRMTPVAAEVGPVVVRASELKPERYARTRKYDNFYRRRSQNSGTFITREMVDARNAQKSEDLLRMVTGVRIRSSLRARMTVRPSWCGPAGTGNKRRVT